MDGGEFEGAGVVSDLDFENIMTETDSRESEEIRQIKSLVSVLQGAPYPTNVNDELYRIWYEHSLNSVSDALAYLDRHTDD